MIRRRKRFDNPLQQYWRILVKRRWTLAGCFGATVLLAWLHTESIAPLYQARAKLFIDDPTRWLGIRDSARLNWDWYTTQFEVLKSKPIITRVVESLDLERSYRVAPSRLELLKSKLLGLALEPPAADVAALVPAIQRSLSIRPQTSTGLVDVMVDASDPVLARDIANALVHVFVEENLNQRIQLSMQATDYLTQRLQKISERIQDKERELEDFEQSEGLDMMAALTLGDDQLADFTGRYLDAQAKKWEMQEQLRVLRSMASRDSFVGITGSEMKGSPLESRTQELFEARLRLDKLQKQGYKDKHPELIKTRDEIDTISQRLRFETRAHIAGMETELAALEQRERSLGAMIQQLQPGAALERKKRAQYEFLQREVEIQKGFYESYNEQLRRLQLLDEVKPTTMRVIEEAGTPPAPYAPDKKRNMALAVFSGLILGLFVAFLRDYLDDTIKAAEDIEDYLEIPVVGTVPMIRETKERGRLLPWQLDTSSMVIEAYRGLRTNLQFFETERPLRTILVSSGGPSEGKSTTAANIALTLVQMGKRVCIVDTDMRRPILHRLFGKPNQGGIASILADLDQKDNLLVPTSHDHLFLLPCGPVPPNPAELLASRRMEKLTESLLQEFDYVIFDSPPVLMVTDALVLSSLVDGVLLVLKAGETRIGAAQQALDSFAAIKANVIGAVLNQIQFSHSRYYPYYSKYYGKYGYTYGQSTPQKKAKRSRSRDRTVVGSRKD